MYLEIGLLINNFQKILCNDITELWHPATIRQYECVRRKFPNGNVDEKSITFTRLRQETNMIGYRYENKFLTVLINTFTNIKKTDNHH